MGHLAHNANLSVKAILGLAAYGDLCRMRGDSEDGGEVLRAWRRPTPAHWMKVAAEGDHYRLAFDKPGTWSQKYNLVWDRILGLNVFPPSVAAEGSCALQESDAALRRAAGFPHAPDQDRLVDLERDTGARTRPTSKPSFPRSTIISTPPPPAIRSPIRTRRTRSAAAECTPGRSSADSSSRC